MLVDGVGFGGWDCGGREEGGERRALLDAPPQLKLSACLLALREGNVL